MAVLTVGFAGFAAELRDQGYGVIRHSQSTQIFGSEFLLMNERVPSPLCQHCSAVLSSLLPYSNLLMYFFFFDFDLVKSLWQLVAMVTVITLSTAG